MSENHKTAGPNFWMAVGLIFIGVLFLLDNLGILDFRDIWELWPLLFVVLGVVKLTSTSPSDKRSGWFFIGFGAFLLLLTFDVIDWSTVWQFWPLILIWLGVSIIYRHKRGQPVWYRLVEKTDEGRLDVLAIFGGNERKVTSDRFEGGSITAICGGTRIDLTSTKLASDRAVLNVFACCGGAELLVPADWKVEMVGTPIMGGFEDSRDKAPSAGEAGGKTLVITGLVILGGLQVRNG